MGMSLIIATGIEGRAGGRAEYGACVGVVYGAMAGKGGKCFAGDGVLCATTRAVSQSGTQ